MPTRWESQKNGNVSIHAFNLALNQFTFHKAFHVTFNLVFRHEIEYPFVERDHSIHRCLLNCLPKFINCFRFNNLPEILLSKYSTDIFWEIGRKAIVAVEDQFEGSLVICLETNIRKLLWIRIFFCDT